MSKLGKLIDFPPGLFGCQTAISDGTIHSHHPPATAYSIINQASGVHLEGYNAQKASFSKTIYIKQIGNAVLTVPVPGSSDPQEKDTYLITLPSLHVEGLLFGSPFIELDGASYITSSTGYTAKIDYSGKGWVSGKKNSFTATLYPTGKEKEVLYNASGQWTKTFDMYSGPAKRNSPDTLVETWNPATTPMTALAVAPLEKQHPLESRRAWANVAAGIARGDMDYVGREKAKIENAQRAMRKRERDEGRVWERRFFSAAADGKDAVLEKLGRVVGLAENGDADKTGGLWRYDPAKAEKLKTLGEPTEEEKVALARDLLGQ